MKMIYCYEIYDEDIDDYVVRFILLRNIIRNTVEIRRSWGGS